MLKDRRILKVNAKPPITEALMSKRRPLSAGLHGFLPKDANQEESSKKLTAV